MNPNRSRRTPGRRFSSDNIVLLLGGALATTAALGLSGCDDDDPPEPPLSVLTKVVSQAQLTQDLQQDREEENNSYVPGLGYYHSLHHSWFPYPFDYYYPGLGFYRGGAWHPARYTGIAFPLRSKPHWKTVTDDQPGTSVYHGNSFAGVHAFSSGGSYGDGFHGSGITRGIFTSPHSSGFHSGFGGHFGGS